MAVLLDTSVVIPLRDGDDTVRCRLNDLSGPILVSIVTVVELEGGVDEADVDLRRQRLDVVLEPMNVLPFGPVEAGVYGDVVRRLGYSRRKVLDRMIAAQAIVAGASIITLNAADFRDIPGLKLMEW